MRCHNHHHHHNLNGQRTNDSPAHFPSPVCWLGRGEEWGHQRNEEQLSDLKLWFSPPRSRPTVIIAFRPLPQCRDMWVGVGGLIGSRPYHTQSGYPFNTPHSRDDLCRQDPKHFVGCIITQMSGRQPVLTGGTSRCDGGGTTLRHNSWLSVTRCRKLILSCLE